MGSFLFDVSHGSSLLCFIINSTYGSAVFQRHPTRLKRQVQGQGQEANKSVELAGELQRADLLAEGGAGHAGAVG